MKSLSKLFNKININGKMLFDEPLSEHSTFRIGGKADVYFIPEAEKDLLEASAEFKRNGIRFFILGGGANILFSDSGFRGAVIDTSRLCGVSVDGSTVTAGAGVPFSELSAIAGSSSLSGLEYFYGMPGSAGGSIYMNARCYGQSVSDILQSVRFIDESGSIQEYMADQNDFSYKSSPFMNTCRIITGASFKLRPGDREELLKKMEEHKKDRETKGHYMYPCAGSVFKNNREFGEPTGKIIDSLGLRGYTIGGAMVSPLHANIVVNRGGALSSEVRELVSRIEEKVFRAYGFHLEREIIYID